MRITTVDLQTVNFDHLKYRQSIGQKNKYRVDNFAYKFQTIYNIIIIQKCISVSQGYTFFRARSNTKTWSQS